MHKYATWFGHHQHRVVGCRTEAKTVELTLNISLEHDRMSSEPWSRAVLTVSAALTLYSIFEASPLTIQLKTPFGCIPLPILETRQISLVRLPGQLRVALTK